MKQGNIKFLEEGRVYLCHLGASARKEAFILARELRDAGVVVDMYYEERGLKAQMKQANKNSAAVAIIIGENEIQTGKFQVRDLRKSSQEEVHRNQVIAYVSTLLEL